ncbi:MAG: HK97 family phage prohead protease [Pseudomonadota bacterium]
MSFMFNDPLEGLETKYTALSQLTETGERGRIKGYASRFGEADQSGDVVAPGAFTASLERLAAAGRSVKLLWQHDPAQPIGVWEKVIENKSGLWVSGRVLTDLQRGREAALLMEAGAIDGLSIGYRVVRAEPNRETGGRTLLEIDLWEVSLVTFPMLPTARADITKEAAPEIDEAGIGSVLTELARSASARPGTAPWPSEEIATALAEALAG